MSAPRSLGSDLDKPALRRYGLMDTLAKAKSKSGISSSSSR
jgi:hypothetical protein